MDRFWDSIIEPILTLRRPQSIVEIGADKGTSTRLILDFCARQGATLHSIDPAPSFDVEAWRREHGERFVFHAALSLEAIPRLGRFDVVLLDGDHNWYTVYHELKLLERRGRELGQAFPLIVFHDIGWPYGRRDLYYDPATIPPEFLQPYDRKGLQPTGDDLIDSGGINYNMCHALRPGGPRNGVLTAIEDFHRETQEKLTFTEIPGFNGLGLLFPHHLQETHGELIQFLQSLKLPPPLKGHFDRVEAARIRLQSDLSQTRTRLSRLEAETASSQGPFSFKISF